MHTSGVEVIKNNMTDKLIQEELDSVLDTEEYIEDHNPQGLDTLYEAEYAIAEFKSYMERFKRCHSELKVALGEGYGDRFSGREDKRKTFRKYLNVLETCVRATTRARRTRSPGACRRS